MNATAAKIEAKIEANKRKAFRTTNIIELRKLDRQLDSLRGALARANRA